MAFDTMSRRCLLRGAILVVLLLGCVPAGSLPGGSNPGTTTGGTTGGGSGSFGGGGGTTGGLAGGCLGLGNPTDATHQEALDALNAYRQANGLGTLRYSVTLQNAADAHAKDMHDRNFFDHVNPDGDGPGDRAVAAGFCHPYGGENIAYGQNANDTVSQVMTAWQNSPGHNANMLRAGFEYVGIGVYVVSDGVNTYYYWVQLFAFDQ